MADVLKKLYAFTWKGISFPITTFETPISHTIIQHRFYGEDGADLEDVGVDPLTITCTAVFRNSLFEKFNKPLYPDIFLDFMAVAAERSTGVMIHPQFGIIYCKIVSATPVWRAEVRDGIDVNITFVQDAQPEFFEKENISNLKTVAQAYDKVYKNIGPNQTPVERSGIVSGQDLDNPNSQRKKTPQELAEDDKKKVTFAEMADQIQAIADYPQRLDRTIAGKIDAVKYRVERLYDTIDKTTDPTQWKTKRSIEQAYAAANNIEKDLLKKMGVSDDVSVYKTTTDSTFGELCVILKCDVGTLMNLNPQYVRYPAVPANSSVRYKKK